MDTWKRICLIHIPGFFHRHINHLGKSIGQILRSQSPIQSMVNNSNSARKVLQNCLEIFFQTLLFSFHRCFFGNIPHIFYICRRPVPLCFFKMCSIAAPSLFIARLTGHFLWPAHLHHTMGTGLFFIINMLITFRCILPFLIPECTFKTIYIKKIIIFFINHINIVCIFTGYALEQLGFLGHSPKKETVCCSILPSLYFIPL